LNDLLRDPTLARSFGGRAWSEALLAARRTVLVASLAARLDAVVGLDRLPRKVGHYAHGALLTAEANQRVLRWEVRCLEAALAADPGPIVLLKGSAYAMAGLAVARGRLASDVDILVARDRLGAVESALLAEGWEPLKQNAYDDHYYRAWMHELPPFRHRERGVIVDVHHTILPLTGRVRPDAARLIARALAVPGSRFRVLAPADMVIHAVVHGFQDGDLKNGLRDLVDIDGLLRQFGTAETFWDDLLAETRHHGAGRAMWYAVDAASRILVTPVPARVVGALSRDAPPWPVMALMRRLIAIAARPERGDRASRAVRLARLLLFVRSHWLRMPPLMLARHLASKAWRRRMG
jgi:hypothetical protein